MDTSILYMTGVLVYSLRRIFVLLDMLSSGLPSFSDGSESIGKDRNLGEYGREPLDQRQQPVLGHGGDELVEQAALAKQRVGASLGGVGLEVPVIA